jgi:peptidoglycan/xylan/chitin deacetylase (PgdA/CDA1 family)
MTAAAGMHLVTLTFDNGPTPGVTDGVLDTLAERGILTTFFVVGERLAAPGARRLMKRAVGEGHWVGNHSLTHTVALGQLDDAGVDREIDGAEACLVGLPRPDRLFRPFGNGGAIDGRLLSGHAVRRLREGRFTCVLWNSVPRDWADPDGWVDRALDDVRATPHTLVVLHDVPGAAGPRLGELLDRLGEVGVEHVQEFPDVCVPIRRGQPTSAFGLIGLPATGP